MGDAATEKHDEEDLAAGVSLYSKLQEKKYKLLVKQEDIEFAKAGLKDEIVELELELRQGEPEALLELAAELAALQLRIVRLLIAAGADVNAVDPKGHGTSALHLAAYYGLTDIVAALIAAGADVCFSCHHPLWGESCGVLRAVVGYSCHMKAAVVEFFCMRLHQLSLGAL